MEEITAIKNHSVKAPMEAASPGMNLLNSSRKEEFNTSDVINRSQKKIEEKARDVKENSTAKMERIAESMENYIRSAQRDLKIQVHSGTGDIIVKVISGKDGKVIRQIPSQEMLDLAAKIDMMTGALFNESA